MPSTCSTQDKSIPKESFTKTAPAVLGALVFPAALLPVSPLPAPPASPPPTSLDGVAVPDEVVTVVLKEELIVLSSGAAPPVSPDPAPPKLADSVAKNDDVDTAADEGDSVVD
jgi:hypothetical protein